MCITIRPQHMHDFNFFSSRPINPAEAWLRVDCDDTVLFRSKMEASALTLRNFCEGPKWVVAVIVDQLGLASYVVQVHGGQKWKRHVDHLRDTTGLSAELELTGPEDDMSDVLVWPLVNSSSTNHPHRQSNTTLQQLDSERNKILDNWTKPMIEPNVEFPDALGNLDFGRKYFCRISSVRLL